MAAFKNHKGKWVVIGLPSEVRAGQTATVTLRDGSTKDEYIAQVSRRTYKGRYGALKGVDCVHGYVGVKPNANVPSASQETPSDECWECARAKRGGYLRRHLFDGCDTCGSEYDG